MRFLAVFFIVLLSSVGTVGGGAFSLSPPAVGKWLVIDYRSGAHRYWVLDGYRLERSKDAGHRYMDASDKEDKWCWLSVRSDGASRLVLKRGGAYYSYRLPGGVILLGVEDVGAKLHRYRGFLSGAERVL